jgi:streptomycin 6-kinase
MPRWRGGGSEWLATLPRLVRDQCRRWNLRLDGPVRHGSNAIAIAVTRADEELMLRMAPPRPDVDEQVRALRFWNGRGTVRLVQADPQRGALLLERLAADDSPRLVPVDIALGVLGRMMRRLAIPAPPHVQSTATIVAARTGEMEADWVHLGRPFLRCLLTDTLTIATSLSTTTSTLAVNTDLYSDQILRGRREPWLAVDPVLRRGDIEYDLARALWTRIDEMPHLADIRRHFDTAAGGAGVDRDRARDWVFFRGVDYWLWGLRSGLTEDPNRCQRLVEALH